MPCTSTPRRTPALIKRGGIFYWIRPLARSSSRCVVIPAQGKITAASVVFKRVGSAALAAVFLTLSFLSSRMGTVCPISFLSAISQKERSLHGKIIEHI